jgi:hypothetical protein
MGRPPRSRDLVLAYLWLTVAALAWAVIGWGIVRGLLWLWTGGMG